MSFQNDDCIISERIISVNNHVEFIRVALCVVSGFGVDIIHCRHEANIFFNRDI